MSGATICFLAESLVMPIRSFLKHFRSEFEAFIRKAETVAPA
jgi:NADH:ubiquinone oxidoreductase subunit F (NADH-binding)